MVAKGSGFLKVTGILMIIGGAIALILSIVALAGIGMVAELAAMASALGADMSVINMGLLYFAGILSLVGAIAELVAGILGVAYCKKPEKANVCLILGIIVAVLSVVGAILTAAGGNGFPVVSFLLGLVLPVLYIIGAVKNKA